MTIRESRKAFWIMMLVGSPLLAWGVAIVASDVLHLVDSESWGYVVLGALALLAVAAGVATRRSWLETAAGTVVSIVAFGVLFVALFFLLVPEDIFR